MSKLKVEVLHHEAEVAELRADRQLATEYLKASYATTSKGPHHLT